MNKKGSSEQKQHRPATAKAVSSRCCGTLQLKKTKEK
jgi:hypothetical protein